MGRKEIKIIKRDVIVAVAIFTALLVGFFILEFLHQLFGYEMKKMALVLVVLVYILWDSVMKYLNAVKTRAEVEKESE